MDLTRPVTTRFAPSPTGRLHVGNIRTALHNWLFARKCEGCFLLRLDDTDRERSREVYVDHILADLEWLGLRPDAVFRQSERLQRYDEVLARLEAEGRVYRCYESPQELELKRKVQLSRGRPPVYDRAALSLTESERAALEAEGQRPHWRFKLDTEAPVRWTDLVRGETHVEPASLSDPVVRRADGSYLYMLLSVVDDIDMEVTHVVRGEDHVTNSGIQIQMFEALGSKAPAFAHEALLTSAEGPLSKRLGSEGLDAVRDAGLEALSVIALLARLGSSLPVEPVTSIEPLIQTFAFEHFGRAPARFDPEELKHLNSRIVHQLDFTEVEDRLPFAMGPDAWQALRPNLDKVGDVLAWWRVIDGEIAVSKMAPEDVDFLREARELLAVLDWGDGSGVWSNWTGMLKARLGRKGRALFLPLRLALTGEDHGPEMQHLIPLIGREKALARLDAAVRSAGVVQAQVQAQGAR